MGGNCFHVVGPEGISITSFDCRLYEHAEIRNLTPVWGIQSLLIYLYIYAKQNESNSYRKDNVFRSGDFSELTFWNFDPAKYLLSPPVTLIRVHQRIQFISKGLQQHYNYVSEPIHRAIYSASSQISIAYLSVDSFTKRITSAGEFLCETMRGQQTVCHIYLTSMLSWI